MDCLTMTLCGKRRQHRRRQELCCGLLILWRTNPTSDPNARGALVGLTAAHTRGHIVRAILEGVAFSLKDTLTLFSEMSVPVRSIRVGGGGARSALWRQIQADVYGHPVDVVAAEEGAAYGAALLAGVGAKFWNSVDDACAEVVHVSETIEPRPEALERMQRQYLLYRQLYPALKQVNDALSAE